MTEVRTKRPVRRPAWREPIAGEHCNFHKHVPAVAVFAGTPLCQGCMPAASPDARGVDLTPTARGRGDAKFTQRGS